MSVVITAVMTNETILRAFLQQVWNEKRKNLVSHYIASEYIIYTDHADPWEGKTIDHAEYTHRLDHSFIPFPDMHFDIQSLVADGDQVAITWIMTGTNLGPIGQFPATGKPIRTTGMTIYYFKGEQLCGHSQVFDRTTVMQQLGFTG